MTIEALVAAGIGLVGALIGVLGAMAVSWLKNRHDAAQRERERVMGLRREVYLEAAEAIASFPQYLVSFANTDIPIESLTPLLSTKPGWQIKIHAVASLSTIAAFAEADALFIETAFQILPMRHRIDELRKQAEEAARQRSQLTQYQGALHTALQAQLSGQQGPNALLEVDAIRAAIEKSHTEITASHEHEATLCGERDERIKELLKFALTKGAKHRLLLAKATVAVRREIEAPIDEDRYLELMTKIESEVLADFRALSDQPGAIDERAGS